MVDYDDLRKKVKQAADLIQRLRMEKTALEGRVAVQERELSEAGEEIRRLQKSGAQVQGYLEDRHRLRDKIQAVLDKMERIKF